MEKEYIVSASGDPLKAQTTDSSAHPSSILSGTANGISMTLSRILSVASSSISSVFSGILSVVISVVSLQTLY